MRFFDNPLVTDTHRAHHQQAHVAHDVIGQFGIGNIIASDIQAESLALQAAAIAEIDLEIEHHAILHPADYAHFAGAR